MTKVSNEREAPHDVSEPKSTRVHVAPGGAVAIPKTMCEALGVKEGDVLVATEDGGEIRLATFDTLMERS